MKKRGNGGDLNNFARYFEKDCKNQNFLNEIISKYTF